MQRVDCCMPARSHSGGGIVFSTPNYPPWLPKKTEKLICNSCFDRLAVFGMAWIKSRLLRLKPDTIDGTVLSTNSTR